MGIWNELLSSEPLINANGQTCTPDELAKGTRFIGLYFVCAKACLGPDPETLPKLDRLPTWDEVMERMKDIETLFMVSGREHRQTEAKQALGQAAGAGYAESSLGKYRQMAQAGEAIKDQADKDAAAGTSSRRTGGHSWEGSGDDGTHGPWSKDMSSHGEGSRGRAINQASVGRMHGRNRDLHTQSGKNQRNRSILHTSDHSNSKQSSPRNSAPTPRKKMTSQLRTIMVAGALSRNTPKENKGTDLKGTPSRQPSKKGADGNMRSGNFRSGKGKGARNDRSDATSNMTSARGGRNVSRGQRHGGQLEGQRDMHDLAGGGVSIHKLIVPESDALPAGPQFYSSSASDTLNNMNNENPIMTLTVCNVDAETGAALEGERKWQDEEERKKKQQGPYGCSLYMTPDPDFADNVMAGLHNQDLKSRKQIPLVPPDDPERLFCNDLLTNYHQYEYPRLHEMEIIIIFNGAFTVNKYYLPHFLGERRVNCWATSEDADMIHERLAKETDILSDKWKHSPKNEFLKYLRVQRTQNLFSNEYNSNFVVMRSVDGFVVNLKGKASSEIDPQGIPWRAQPTTDVML